MYCYLLPDFTPNLTSRHGNRIRSSQGEGVLFWAMKVGTFQGIAKEEEKAEGGSETRLAILDRGIVPEQLPPAEDAKKVERRLASE